MGRLVKIDNRTDNNTVSSGKKGRLVRVSDTPELELGFMIRDAKKQDTPAQRPSSTSGNTARQQPRANSFVQGGSKLQQMEAQREERQQKTQNPAREARAAQIVREAEARSPRARSVQKTSTGTRNDRGSVQRGRNGYTLGEKRSQDTRVGKAAQSIALNTIGSTEMLGEGLKQANENVDILAGDQTYSRLRGQYEQMGRQLNGAVQRYGMDSPEAESIRQSMNALRERLTARRGQIEKTIDTGSHAYRTAQMGQEAASQALEGLSGVGGFLGETALSIADNAALMPLAAINPALPLVIMSIKAAGSRAKELTDQGTAAGEALSRGTVSGIIEGLSENVSLGSLLEMVRTGGRGWLVNLLKQAGVEGAEEITSYLANYAMDKAAQDPNAQFDAGEMLRQGASGALSGLVFGGVGTAVNRLNGYRGVDYSQVDSIQGDGAPSAIERSVQNVRQTLGAEGQSTFDQMRTEVQDPSAAVDYTERFVDAYNKGKRNESIPQAAEMTEAEAETRAAWNAGRVDALTQEGARNKQNQATREAGAGIIRTEYTDSLDQKTVSALDRAAKQLGVTVEFADEVAEGNANAEIQGNRITISKVTDNPVRAVFGHEITHRIQELSADSYAEYKAAVQEVMGDRWALELEDIKARAEQYGLSYSEEQLADEVVADYAGGLLQNEGTLEQFIQSAQSKPTLLQRIAQVFRDLVNKLRGTEKARAERALGKLEKAYREAAKAEQSGGVETRYSIKRTSQMTLEQQLRDYYAGKLKSSDSLYFGATPDTLRSAGLDALPLAFGTADFRKSVKDKHNVPRRAIKKTQDNLQNALFAFSDGSRIGFVVPDIDADGKPLLIGIEKGVQMDAEMVNAIRSMYGLDHPAEWIQNQIESGKTAIVLDEEKANTFLYPYGYKASRKEGIRSMGPSIPSSKENVKRFSLKKPVEETDKLLALHNKDENSILAALDLGGLPMPSIAVVKARDGHSKYGPISLVFNKDTIDPQRSSANKVYGGDAWTPTAPRVDYPVNSKKASQVEHELHRLAGDVSVAGGIFGNSAALRSMGIDDTSTRNTAELAEKLASTDTVRAAYLADQGKSLEPVKMDKVWDRFGNDTLQKVIDRLGVDTLAEMEANLETGESVKGALGENAEVIRDILRDYYREKGEPMLRRMAVKKHWTDAEINERRQTRIDNSMDEVSIFALEDIVHHAWDMYQDGGATKGEIDRMATSDALRSAVDDRAVEEWIAGKLDGLLGEAGIYNGKDPYTPSGNSRSFSQLHYAYTLENIVKAMKEGQEERGGNTWGASAKTLQSVATPEYRSIQEIKADSGRLGMTEEAEYEAKLQAIDDKIDNIITKVKQGNNAHSDNPFVESDIIGGILVDTANGKKTVDAIVKAFSKEGYKIGNQTALDIQSVYKTAAEMPTGYFEAKPQRAVGFDEVLAAVIPSDSSQKLRDALGEAGVRTLEYKAGDEADRLAKINSVENAQFSLKGQGANEALVEKLTRQVRDGKITMDQALEQVRQDAVDRTTAAELRSRKQLEQENDRLRERVSALKAQMKPTEQKTVRKTDTDRVSREIIKAYDSEADAESIRDQVKALGDYLVESGGGDEGVSWEGLMSRALPLGREIVENARVLNDDMAKEYAELRSYLRETKLVISEQDSHDITDYNATRKALMGTVSLRRGENGNVESVYADMAARWPEFFNTEAITHPAEMVEHIREVMDAIKPSYENPHSANLDYAAEMAAQDVIERVLGPDVRQSPETYADRQATALEAQKARYQALLRKEKAKRADAVAELKAKARAKDAARSESRNARDIRGKIERHTKALSKKLLNPTDKSHIPQRLRGPVAKALESINLQGKKEGSKRAEAFTQLKKAYQAIAQDDAGGFIVDPDLLGDQAEGFTGLFDRLIETADTPIHQMNASQLADVWKVVRGLEHAVETAGKTLASEKYAKTQDWVTAFSIDTLTRRPKRNGVMQRFIQDEMDPYTFFHQYGDSGMEVYRMLRNAQDTQTRRISALGEQVQRIIGDADMKKIQTTRHTFTTEEGKTLTLTDGQIMDLYNLARRQQAQEHLMTGGIVQPEIKRSGKQKHIEQGNDSVRITANDIQEIIGVLTPEERAIADGLQKLTTTTLSGWGNEASMGAYGYEKFTQGDYWPIRSAKNALHSNVEKGGNNTRSIKNIGMAKATIPGANNAVEIGDVFDTFSRHAADMIDYSVWLLPMEDAGRLYNYRFRDEKGPTGQTIKGMLDKIGGKGSQQYWARLMEDIQNGINASADTSAERLIQKVVGNTKGARVGANVRVVLQQPTAFLRANAVLSPGSLLKGLAKGVTPGSGWKKAQKWAGIAKIKDVGGFDQGNARSVSQQIYNTQTAMDKLNTVTSWGAEKADALTWGRLWNASEHETKRLHPELEAGSDAFYRKTAEIFTDMIDQSQVVDGILQRSQIMRSGNAFNKMATAFMGEPTKTLNMFIRAWDDFRYETDGKKRTAARGKFARTAVALVATDVVNAFFQALWDAVRDDDKDKTYRQRLWRAMTGLEGDEVTPGDYAKALASGNIADNMNPLGRLPYVKDVLSIWQGYTVERADMDAISDAIKAAQNLNDAIQGKGKRTAWYAAEQLIGTTAVMFGVPVKTVTRDVRGLIRSIAQSTGSWEVVYEAEKFTYKPAANKKQFMDLLWTVKQKDESAYEAIRKDMEEHGYFAEDPKDAYHVVEASPAEQTRAYIDEQMEKRDRENSKSAGKISYEGLMASVTQTSAYQQASAASKNKAADKASALAKGTSTGRSLAGKLEKYKIDPEEYLEYLLWMDKYDEPSKNGKYGSYTNEERKKAIDATNASKSTKAGLWILAGGSEKSNPYD
uniref:Nuclease n=1 Tax=Podoviridae sp. ctZih56 TaxID=2827741 RepID=A0A8S5SGE8_9CAUD|nr:MAG TPA: nuclease [Podoviridae sp. ctZih56]